MVERGWARMESGPLNPNPVSVVCRGHSIVLGFTWDREREGGGIIEEGRNEGREKRRERKGRGRGEEECYKRVQLHCSVIVY